MRKTIICGMGLLIAGCVAPSQWLQRPGTPDVVRRRAADWGFIGAPLAEHIQNVCIEDYEKLGYVPVDPSPPAKVAGR